jgi:hypothetical protein
VQKRPRVVAQTRSVWSAKVLFRFIKELYQKSERGLSHSKRFALHCKRPALLLEILIALALATLCILPLMAPHASLIKAQRQFLQKVELDHSVNLIYAEILKQLYMNKPEWQNLAQNTFEIDDDLIKNAGVISNSPFKGHYHFTALKHRPKKESDFSTHLYQLTFEFWLKNQSYEEASKKKEVMEYIYKIFIVRDLREDNKVK